MKRLTALQVNSSKLPVGMHGDGNGLYLSVRESGSRSWVFRYRNSKGRSREMGLGTAGPVGVPLQEARDRVVTLKAELRAGLDPIDTAKKAAIAEQTFGEFALNDWLPTYSEGFKNPRTKREVQRILELHTKPIFDMPIHSVTETEILAVLKPIWSTKPKTARDLRARLETILNAATTKKHREGSNPARWDGNLDSIFGRDTKRKRELRVKKHPAVPYRELPAVVQALRERHKTAATNVNLALEFLILTGARTDEVRSMVPAEVDFKNALWQIPKTRMKGSEDHVVPLSSRAVEILQMALKPDRPYIFGGLLSPTKPLGHNAMAHALKAVAPGYTPHGLRSTFRDWIGNETDYPRELAEHALAHSVGDQSERAYRREKAIERRRPIMTEWAAFLG